MAAAVQTRTVGIRDVGIKNTSRGDLFQVTTADGTEYSTFNAGLGHQARQLIGRNVLLRFIEKTVDKDGRTFVNRYYEGAEPVEDSFGSAPDAQFDAPPTGDTKEMRIMRQTATKVAAHVLGYLDESERNRESLIAVAEYLVAYYRNGPATPVATFAAVDEPIPHTDDDIPF